MPTDNLQTSQNPAMPRPMLERLGASAAQLSSLRPASAFLRRTLWVTLGVVIVGSVVIAIVTLWGSLPDFDWRLNPIWLVGAAAAFAVLHLSHAALWQGLLRALDQHVDRRRGRAIWCTSGLARYTPGSFLMPMVRVAMTEPEGVPKRICLASVVYELALLLTGAVIVGAYALVSAPALGGHAGRYAVLILPALALVALHPRVFHRLADIVLMRLGRDRLPRALPMVKVLAFAALYTATWVVAGFGLYALIHGVHPVEPDDLLVVIAAPAVGYIAALLAFMLPGGLGARETGLAVVLSAALPVAVAVAAAVALRIVQMVVELTCAVVTPLLARRAR
jgi:glycosyltransferase 2 family protein